MAATPEQRGFLKDAVTYLRAMRGMTLDQVADALKARGFSASASKVGGWGQGKFAPSSRELAIALDEVLEGDGRILRALGYLPKDPNLGYLEIGRADGSFDVRIGIDLVDGWGPGPEGEVIELLDMVGQTRERAFARWMGPGDPPSWLAAALARIALRDDDFALAAEGGLPDEEGPEQRRPSPDPEPEGP